MSRTKRKNKRRLLKRKNILYKFLIEYETLNNLVENSDNRIIPKLSSISRIESGEWLCDNEDYYNTCKKEYLDIEEQLKELE